MKKTRLISMLLSAAMLVSSLPFAAAMTTAASASPAVEIELGTDLLDGVSFTADVNTLDITSEVGEGYLHLYNTPAATSGEWKTGIGYKTDGVTFKKDTAYGIKFDMRLAFGPVASNKEGTDRSKNSAVDPTLYFTCVSSMTLTDILLKSGTSTSFAAYAPTPQGKVTDEAKTSYYVPTAGADVTMNTAWAGNGLYNVYPNVYKTGTLPGYMTDWSTYSYVFVPTADVVDPQIAIVSRPTRSTVPIDIDNFSIVEYKQDGTSTVVETISFDNANAASLIAADANDLSGKFFPASGTAGAANFDSGKLKVEIGTQYTKLVAPTGAATVNYDFDDGVTLSAGEYELSGEARLNYFSNYTDDEDNKGSLTASVTAGETVSKTLDISHEWTAFDGITLTVVEGTELTAVTLAFTDPQRTETTAHKTVDMRNVSLIKTKAVGTANSMLEGASAKTDTSYEVVNVEDGNKFLHVNGRIYHYINGSGVYTTLANTGTAYTYVGTYNKDTVYYFGFDARTSVEGVSTEDGYDEATAAILHQATTQFGIDTAITAADDGSTFTAKTMTPTDRLASDYVSATEYIGNKAKTYWNNGYYAIELTPEWTYCEFAFKPSADVTTETSVKTYIGFSNITGYHNAVPIDIDNAKVWYYEDGATEPTYIMNDNFDTGSDDSYFTNTSNFAKRSNNFCNASGASGHTFASTLSIIDEYDYEKIAADNGKASVTYTLDLEPGLYTFTGNARLDYHNPGGEQAEQWYLDYNGLEGALTDSPKANHLTYVAGEDNKAALTVTAAVGAETATGSVDITTEWSTAASVSFLVPAGADTREVNITVTMEDKTTAADMALDLRDLEITLTTPIEELYADIEHSFFDGAPAVSTAPYEFVDVADGNTFIHANDRRYSFIGSSGTPTTNIPSGVGYQHNGTYAGGTMYYIGFDARMSVEGVSTEDGYDAETVGMLHAMQSRFKLTDTLAGEGGSTSFSNIHMTPTDKLDSAYASTSAYHGNEASTVWQSGGYYAVKLTPDWTYCEFAFMPIEDVVWGTSSNNTHIGFSKLAGSHHSSVPMDIDNVKIWYYEDGATEPTYITDDNFEGAGDYIGTPHSTAGRENNFFAVSGAGGHTHACYVALSSENDYEKIGAQGGEASITYTFDLTPGLYTVSGEARLDYYNPGGEQAEYAMNGHPLGSTVYGGGHHLTYVAAEDNMAELTISVEAGSKTYASSTEIYTEWDSAGGLSFKVPEGSDSNEVKITFTMNDTTSAANMALDLRALSLSSLGALTECELGEDMLTLANASSTAEITAVEGGDKYNQYLHLYNRKYSAANSGIGFCSVTQFKANTLYYIKLDARVALPTVSAEDGFAAENVEIRQAAGAMFEVKDIVSEDSDGDAYNSYYLTPTDKVDTDAGYTFKASENEAETVWNENGFYEVVLNEDWTTLEFAFVPTVTATRRETGLALFTSGDYSNAVPIDIDNVEIFYYASGSTEPTYVDSFDFERGIIDIDYVMSTDILGHFYVANGTSTKNANSSGVISVEQEKGYDRISLGNTKGAVVNYDFGGMTLEPGVYALDGIMRQDYNNPGGTDAQTAYSAGAHSTYMEGEDNVVAYTATAIVDGEEIVVSSTVTGEWGELPRLTITVPRGAGSTLDEITLTFSDGAAAYNNGIGVRELKLSKISDAYDTNDPEWTGNGVTEIGCFPILDKTETYIEIRDRVHYLDMLKYVNEDITLEVGEYYTLTLWLRGIPDDTGDCGKLGMYVNYPISSRKLSSTWGATQYKGEYDLDVGAFVLKPEWEEHKVTFTALNEEFVLLFEGERTADHSRIVNIAGLSLTASDELGNPTGEELISDWTSEYSGGIGWTTAPYADNTGISYAIIDDYVYKTANADGGNNTVLTYDTDEAFEAGTYTVSGRVRLGNRQDSYVEYALTKLRHTLWLFLVHADDNSAELALTLGGETVDSVNITNEWSDIEFTFTVDSAGVPDLALALDGAFDLDFADLTVYAENN